MLVRDRMSKNPITVDPKASVDEALQIMRKHGVRHIPVSSDGRIVGAVTNQDLIGAWFPSLIEEIQVRDVMDSDPVTVAADATAYQAARLMYNHKLTGLLVVDEGSLVGIITLADILRLFVDLMGLLQDSSRFEVILRPDEHSLKDIHGIIREHGVDVISVALVASSPEERVYSFRLDATDPQPVIKALAEAGYKIYL